MPKSTASTSAAEPVLIGVAWPYANGGLHLGHVAGSLLPPDIFRRAMRMLGHDVLMVSGSDCHGTPILLKAEGEGKTPGQVVDHYHADHVRALRRLGIGFDLFTRTSTANHTALVQEIFLACHEMGYIEKRTQRAPFDPKAGRFLPDRYVEGTCPHCGNEDARGDQCDKCGKTLDPQDLKKPRSKLNPDAAIEFRDTDHFFFLLSKLQPKLEAYVKKTSGHWRPNTINFTQNWLKEGLQDRPITRDLTWGIPIPLEGYDDKRIYVWFEAVCGYFTAAVEWAARGSGKGFADLPDGAANLATKVPGAAKPKGKDAWDRYWAGSGRSYYFLGKDNIPFHTIIWPGILIAYNEWRKKHGKPQLLLPYDVPANEFLNLDGKQFSKSRGISIAVHDVLDRFQADAVRYYLAISMPEQRDSDWTWDDFLSKVNDELVGIIGNFAHRVLSFAANNLGNIPAFRPGDHPTFGLQDGLSIDHFSVDISDSLRQVRLKRAIEYVRKYAQWCNQYMQAVAPWKLLKENRDECEAVVYGLLQRVKALAVFLAPFTPDAADKLWRMLGEKGSVHDAPWSAASQPLQSGHRLAAPEALFVKLEASDIPGAKPAEEAKAAAAKPAAVDEGLVAFSDFQRIQLRIAKVLSVEEHPKADRLFVLRLDVGSLGERQVVAGLRGHYEPEDLVGQTVAFVANLQPAMLRGVESQGMILAADHDGTVSVLNPHRDVPPGATIR